MFTRASHPATVTVNYRNKIELDSKLLSTYYVDTITHTGLITFINKFIFIKNKLGLEIKSAKFQRSLCTDNYGIIIKVSNYSTNFETMSAALDCHIFCVDTEVEIKYLSLNEYFEVDDWKYNMMAFTQVYDDIHLLTHNIVNKWLLSSSCTEYLGVGGEAGYYVKKNITKFTKAKCITNSAGIYTTNKYNLDAYHVENKLVDYKNEKIGATTDNCIMLINISRKGLREFVNELPLTKEIIYIGCCQNAVEKDMKILNDKYIIADYYKQIMFPDSKYILFLIYMKMA